MKDIDVSELNEHQGVMHDLNRTGDSTLVWDRRNQDEIENARKSFAHFVEEKKFAAFSVDKKGEKGEQVREFNPAAERIIFVPPMRGGRCRQ